MRISIYRFVCLRIPYIGVFVCVFPYIGVFVCVFPYIGVFFARTKGISIYNFFVFIFPGKENQEGYINLCSWRRTVTNTDQSLMVGLITY